MVDSWVTNLLVQWLTLFLGLVWSCRQINCYMSDSFQPRREVFRLQAEGCKKQSSLFPILNHQSFGALRSLSWAKWLTYGWHKVENAVEESGRPWKDTVIIPVDRPLDLKVTNLCLFLYLQENQGSTIRIFYLHTPALCLFKRKGTKGWWCLHLLSSYFYFTDN